MTSRATQELALLVEEGTLALPVDAQSMPWTIARAIGYVRTIRSIYQRAAMDPDSETALPPRWWWLGPQKRIDDWFRSRAEAFRSRNE